MDKKNLATIIVFVALLLVLIVHGFVFGNEDSQMVLVMVIGFVITIGLLMGYIYLRYVRSGKVIAVKDEKGRYWVGPKEWFEPTTKKEDDLE